MVDSIDDIDNIAKGMLVVHNKKENKKTPLCCENIEEVLPTRHICHLLGYHGESTHEVIETNRLVN